MTMDVFFSGPAFATDLDQRERHPGEELDAELGGLAAVVLEALADVTLRVELPEHREAGGLGDAVYIIGGG